MILRSHGFQISMPNLNKTAGIVTACLLMTFVAFLKTQNANAISANVKVQATPPPYLFKIRMQGSVMPNGNALQLVLSSWSQSASENGHSYTWSGTGTDNSITLNSLVADNSPVKRRTGASTMHFVEVYSLAPPPVVLTASGNYSMSIQASDTQYWHTQTQCYYAPQGLLTGNQSINLYQQGIGSNSSGASFQSVSQTITTAISYTTFPEFPNIRYYKVFSGSVGSGVGGNGGYKGSMSASGSTTITVTSECNTLASDIQLVCRPLDTGLFDSVGGSVNDAYNTLRSKFGKHCYFLITKPNGTKTTISAFPNSNKLTPKIDGDPLTPPGGCSSNDVGLTKSLCYSIKPSAGCPSCNDDIYNRLVEAYSRGEEGEYDRYTNNSNLWVKRRLIELGCSGIPLPPSAPTNLTETCSRVRDLYTDNLDELGITSTEFVQVMRVTGLFIKCWGEN